MLIQLKSPPPPDAQSEGEASRYLTNQPISMGTTATGMQPEELFDVHKLRSLRSSSEAVRQERAGDKSGLGHQGKSMTRNLSLSSLLTKVGVKDLEKGGQEEQEAVVGVGLSRYIVTYILLTMQKTAHRSWRMWLRLRPWHSHTAKILHTCGNTNTMDE